MVEGALPAKHHEAGKNKKKENKKKNYPPCKHCGKNGHPPFKCWKRPDAKCSKCNQRGHEAVICKSEIQQVAAEAKNAQQEEEDQLFVATCFSSNNSCESWLIDSGCTNHMTYDKEMFKQLDNTEVKWVRIGNGEHIPVKGKGTVAITSYSGTKTLTDVLYVPEINQNLLSVG